ASHEMFAFGGEWLETDNVAVYRGDELLEIGTIVGPAPPDIDDLEPRQRRQHGSGWNQKGLLCAVLYSLRVRIRPCNHEPSTRDSLAHRTPQPTTHGVCAPA